VVKKKAVKKVVKSPLAVAQAEVRRLDGMVKQWAAEAKFSATQVAEMRKHLGTTQVAYQASQHQVKDLEAERDKWQKQFLSASETVESQAKMLSELRQQLKGAQKPSEDAEVVRSENSKLKVKSDQMARHIGDLEIQISGYKKELDRLRHEQKRLTTVPMNLVVKNGKCVGVTFSGVAASE
jgi:chromosome segregation ATPase